MEGLQNRKGRRYEQREKKQKKIRAGSCIKATAFSEKQRKKPGGGTGDFDDYDDVCHLIYSGTEYE